MPRDTHDDGLTYADDKSAGLSTTTTPAAYELGPMMMKNGGDGGSRDGKGVATAAHSKVQGGDDDDELRPQTTEEDRAETAGILGARAGGGAGDEEGRHAGAGAATVAGEYKVYKRRWFGLVSLTFLNIIISWDWLTFAPVSQHAAVYYGSSESTINWLSSAVLFVFVVVAPVTIYFLHWGPKPSIIAAAALALVGNWIRYAGSYSGDGGRFGVVMFGQILIGAAQSFVLSAPTRYSDLWFTSRGRVGATAIMSLANPFGSALGELVVPFMVTQPSDISSMVLYVSIIATVICLPSFFIPAAPPSPPAPSCETPKEPLLASFRRIGSMLEFWLLLIPYGVYVGFFNSLSSLLNQIMLPYGYTSDEAGIAGAVLVVVGLVSSAISSPIIDRTKSFLLAIKLAVPLIGLTYLIFIWMPRTHDAGGVAGPYVVLAVLGAASFSLVPVALEYLAELSHPCSPEVTSTIAWSSGQLLGAIFILISDALKDDTGAGGGPPGNLDRALIFQAVLALVVMPLPMSLGLLGRADKVKLNRVASDERVLHGGGRGVADDEARI